ncbi:MAG: electron transfer flavoprotein subunit alpha, partial [Kiritimatiellia bacterium]|nr:electron transfer flavoprotein subunit alpha [Kiritimatiellia bacterium]
MSNDPIKVIDETCVGCQLCVKACPFGAIEMDDKLAVIDLTKCTLCGACVTACKFDAIEMRESEKVQADFSEYRDVWVFAEQDDDVIQSITYELLGEGRQLADDLGMKLCAVLLGSNVSEQASELITRGAETVYVVDQPELTHFQDEPYAAVISDLVKRHKPNILLCGATTIGRSVISRIAVETGAGLTADCTGLAIDPETKNLMQTRPAFGGNIMATILTPDTRPQMSTVRHKVFKEAEVDASRTGDVVALEVDKALLASRTRRLSFVPEEDTIMNIAEADFIISGGRGMGKPENFDLLHELAGCWVGAWGHHAPPLMRTGF